MKRKTFGFDDERARPRWPSRGNLTAISFAAFLVGATTLGGGAIRIAETFGDEVHVHLSAATQVAADAASGPAAILNGTYSAADLAVTGLSAGPRLMLAGGILVTVLTVMAVAASVMYLCFRLGQGRPFVASLTRALSISAWALILGGIAGQALVGYGGWMVAAELNPNPAVSPFPFAADLDVWPFAIGIVLRLVVAAFRIAERVQSESDRSARQAARLRLDVDGLV
ncbi:hypothetical protein OSC27_12420 [Microbacterium sp. STN6]|uniref:hypothetical protein n=1 Tax=Microbacterium sp. STN6 TaxID=2995588 RepID=UPI0022608F5F|nr:hypothetical protein [Microbacterium sp. STN6]MCX7523076.1 hypothetical protein [Microbacterium sp. STN6]